MRLKEVLGKLAYPVILLAALVEAAFLKLTGRWRG
jgi:hypothetical protein